MLAVALATDITFKEAEQVGIDSVWQSVITLQSSLNVVLLREHNYSVHETASSYS